MYSRGAIHLNEVYKQVTKKTKYIDRKEKF